MQGADQQDRQDEAADADHVHPVGGESPPAGPGRHRALHPRRRDDRARDHRQHGGAELQQYRPRETHTENLDHGCGILAAALD